MLYKRIIILPIGLLYVLSLIIIWPLDFIYWVITGNINKMLSGSDKWIMYKICRPFIEWADKEKE